MSFNHGVRQLRMVCGLLAVVLFAAGCRTSTAESGDAGVSAAQAPAAPAAPQGTSGPAVGTNAAAQSAPRSTTSDLLRIGDSVNVTLLDLPQTQAPMDVTIKEDGSITLPLLNNQVMAAGKTTGELEKDIWQSYVPSFYKHMTVIVKAQGQYYSVKGEVKAPNRYPFTSATTVLKAITSAGDFTDFARKREVKVYRSNGRVETEDCMKALQDPKFDLPVYPGDLISVPRKKLPWQK
jgi:polysaccharide export outer membrane protein